MFLVFLRVFCFQTLQNTVNYDVFRTAGAPKPVNYEVMWPGGASQPVNYKVSGPAAPEGT